MSEYQCHTSHKSGKMANCYGMLYDPKSGKSYTTNTFEDEYIPLVHCNPKTPVHARMYTQQREKVAEKRKKASDKEAANKKRNGLVMAVVIGVCLILLLLMRRNILNM